MAAEIPDHIVDMIIAGKQYDEIKIEVDSMEPEPKDKERLLSKIYDEVTRQTIKSEKEREALLLTIGGTIFLVIFLILFVVSKGASGKAPWILGIIVSIGILRQGVKIKNTEIVLPQETMRKKRLFDKYK